MIGIKVDDSLKQAIEQAAAQEHRTLSGYIRHCVLLDLERLGIVVSEDNDDE